MIKVSNHKFINRGTHLPPETLLTLYTPMHCAQQSVSQILQSQAGMIGCCSLFRIGDFYETVFYYTRMQNRFLSRIYLI